MNACTTDYQQEDEVFVDSRQRLQYVQWAKVGKCINIGKQSYNIHINVYIMCR